MTLSERSVRIQDEQAFDPSGSGKEICAVSRAGINVLKVKAVYKELRYPRIIVTPA